MTVISSGSSNLLERRLGYSTTSTLTENQLRLDSITHSFAAQVSEPTALAGMLAGGLVGRGLRVASFSLLGNVLGESRLAYLAARGGAFAVSLAGEGAAFTGTERLIRGQGVEGFGSAWIQSMINLGTLRMAGLASAGQSQILQRTINSSAMVLANQAAAALGVIDRPTESFTHQFVQALVMDIQCSGSRALIDVAMPSVGRLERTLDLHHETQIHAPRTAVRSLRDRLASNPRALRVATAFGATMLQSLNAIAQPAHGSVENPNHLYTVLHGIATGGLTLSGAVAGLVPALLVPILKGKYRAYAAAPVVLGAGILAARLGTDFSSLRESAGNIAFLSSALLAGLGHEIWVRRRVGDKERIHLWQHETPREQYVRTRSVERSPEEYARIMDAPPVEIRPDDASWSHQTFLREGEIQQREVAPKGSVTIATTSFPDNPIVRDVDGYPIEFSRFVHDAPPKSAGFLKGNYIYNGIFNGPRVTATVEGLMSTLPMTWLYGKWNRVPGRSLRDFLVQKFNISYPERFDWSALDQASGTFNDFFTRPLVTPPEGLEVKPGQTFHDGVLDVVGRFRSLDTGIRLAGKGGVRREWSKKEGQFVDVVGDAVLSLRIILGRAARRFEGESVTVIATYLSPRHWHQTLSPVSGTILDIEPIEGKLHSVDPGIRHIPSDPNFDGRPASYFQSENSRVVITIDTPDYGPVAIVCTAAALVSTSRVFPRVGEQVRLGELLHEYRWGSHNTLVMKSSAVALAPGLVPGSQVYVRGTKPEGTDGIEELFVPRNRLR